MHFGIDCVTPGQAMNPAEKGDGGVRVYLRNVVQQIPRQDKTHTYTVYAAKPGFELLGHTPPGPNVHYYACPGLSTRPAARVVYEQTIYPQILNRAGLDALLSTCNTMPLGAKMPVAVVQQSLQYFYFPVSFSVARILYLRLMVAQAMRRADAVISLSESARQTVIERLKLPPEKVQVVYYGGVHEQFRTAYATRDNPVHDETVAKYIDRGPYIFAISTLFRFKNYERLIRAFALLKQRTNLPHRLLIVGREFDVTRAELLHLAARLSLPDGAVVCKQGAPTPMCPRSICGPP
ncbi:MAG: glycosyltransferase family 4 protein [Chloroflexaceae bacterium]|nr:glycosyltransferase family 4 protein [Chloroflexaceae bacterium]